MADLFGKLKKKYGDQPLEIQKKSVYLFVVSLILGVIAFFLTITMLLTGALVVSVLTGALLLFCALTILLVFTGHYKISVSLFLLFFFGIIFSAIKFDEYVNTYESYVLAGLGSMFLFLTCLVGYTRIQVLAATILNSGAIATVYILDVLPAEQYKISLLDIQNLVVSGMIIILGGVCGIIIMKLQKELVHNAESSRKIVEEKCENLNSFIDQAFIHFQGEGLKLNTSAGSTLERIQDMEGILTNTRNEILQLGTLVEKTSAANSSSLDSVSVMEKTVEQYKQAVENTSSSMEQLIAAIQSISGNISSRQSAIETLVETAKKGGEEMSGSTQAINQINESSADMLDMAKVITAISSKTNLLAMNAAIEAAHAGDSGKGFAVVADEIRKLAEETGSQSKKISESLKNSLDAINSTAEMSNNAAETFGRIVEEVSGVSHLFKEIIYGVKEMSNGTDEILRQISGLTSASGSAESAVQQMVSSINENTSELENVIQQSENLANTITSMARLFKEMQAEAKEVAKVGENNTQTLSSLSVQIEDIKKL